MSEMEERLRFQLDKANHWVGFAEAKNASMVIFACAVLKVAMEKIPNVAGTGLIAWDLWLGFSSFALALVIALLSFFPIRIFGWIGVVWWKEKTEEPNASTNLFFFEHVARLTPFSFLDALYAAEGEGLENPKRRLELDLAGQIVTNSRVASRKFTFFQAALGAVLLGIIFFTIAGIIATAMGD